MKDYKKILEGVVDIINTTEKSDIGFANICTYIGENCHELAESEDERIRKEIIKYLEQTVPHHHRDEVLKSKEWIAWLEKQGEQKPVWSEEDKMIALSIEQVMNCASLLNIVPEKIDKIRTWLKSIKNRVQPKQEWSEEDEVKINRIVACLENLNVADNDILLKDVAWLKSLRPQKQ